MPKPPAVPVRGPDEARALYEANVKLVGYYLRTYRKFARVYPYERDELDQSLHLALWRSCALWEPERTTLANYAILGMHNAVRRFRIAKWRAQTCLSYKQRAPRNYPVPRLYLFSECDRAVDPEYQPSHQRGVWTPEEVREAMVHLLGGLPKRYAYVIRARLGIDQKEAQTLLTIAAQLGVSRERIRQIEQRAMSLLRWAFVKRYTGEVAVPDLRKHFPSLSRQCDRPQRPRRKYRRAGAVVAAVPADQDRHDEFPEDS